MPRIEWAVDSVERGRACHESIAQAHKCLERAAAAALSARESIERAERLLLRLRPRLTGQKSPHVWRPRTPYGFAKG